EALQVKPAASISELAARLGRPIASVSRDIRILQAYGLVELRQEGRSKVPVLIPTHIVIPLSQIPSKATAVSASA
ncbi:MAG: helix-turn-helix domain-containing protein, partial [Clostridia bacterium]|nr:helix-turn-helix domain-containing protein [Clostridia bacterium]